MRKVLTIFTLATVAVLLAACGLLQLGPNTSATIRAAAAKTLTAYAEGYQPILIIYSKLPYCGDPAQPPCRDRELYKKLYAADAAVAECVEAAVKALNEDSADLSGVAACMAKVDEAKLAIASGGIAAKPVVIVVPETEK